jgi:hypothetical protein
MCSLSYGAWRRNLRGQDWNWLEFSYVIKQGLMGTILRAQHQRPWQCHQLEIVNQGSRAVRKKQEGRRVFRASLQDVAEFFCSS